VKWDVYPQGQCETARNVENKELALEGREGRRVMGPKCPSSFYKAFYHGLGFVI
jgi:hypothetical protein